MRVIILFVLAVGLLAMLLQPRAEGVLGAYSTSLDGRTAGQRLNAMLAAKAIDGAVIEPGHVFSFNRTVGPWSMDRGYVRAPVSYEGELVKDWGGGVCQTSTTLYNAGLLAGLKIVERHRHTWAPRYAPPGLDAAVAQYDVDLRLQNPYRWPVRIRLRNVGDSLAFEVLGRDRGPIAGVTGVTTGRVDPMEIVQNSVHVPAGQRRVITRGKPGACVAVYRVFDKGPRAGIRELVSRDSYPAMNRVVALGVAP
ncbi:MAG TPA: VanW family protein [Armatimonadota bacterium]|jgi:vancomycin resistance protein YoaR